MSAAPLAPWLVAQREALLAQRGHAWLLHGPSGLGQYRLGLELVRAWLCEAAPTLPAARGSLPPEGALAALGRPGGGFDAPTLPAARGSLPPEGALVALGRPGGGSEASTDLGACGQCASCHAIDVHTHADLCVLMPEVDMLALGWPLPEKAQAEIDDKARKPSREIRVEAMRAAVEFSQRTSARGRGKAVLVFPAEQMNTITANALLKTLEEPPGDVRFVLASEAAHQLLPTIRSRCLGHTMVWPAQAQMLEWLAGQGVAAAAAESFLRATGGRPDDALALARSGPGPEVWAQFPKAVQRGSPGALADWTPPQAVEALQKLCHDLLALRVGAAPRYFAAADLPPPPSIGALTRWSRALMQEARTAEHPFNAGLMLEALVAQARNVLHSSPHTPPVKT